MIHQGIPIDRRSHCKYQHKHASQQKQDETKKWKSGISGRWFEAFERTSNQVGDVLGLMAGDTQKKNKQKKDDPLMKCSGHPHQKQQIADKSETDCDRKQQGVNGFVRQQSDPKKNQAPNACGNPHQQTY